MNNIEKIVRKIIDKVRKDGDKAVINYTRIFDGISLIAKQLKVSEKEINYSVKKVSPDFLAALNRAKNNIEKFQKEILPKSRQLKKEGIILQDRYQPLDKVGLYIPGGKYPYPSTVLMTAIPAKVAGVKEIIMVTPPQNITNEVLAAAYLCRINRIYRIGGAQAIAALAYGTKTIPKVDKIVGPGNIYVTYAKKIVFGDVGIDSLAGPSEVVIIADQTAPVNFIVADLRAQVEHGSGANTQLVTTSRQIYSNVKNKLGKIANIKLNLVANVDEAINKVNKLSPEHVEVMTKNAPNIAAKIKNAGAVFIGAYSPTAVGDYYAGPSHVLPTGGSARFSSGLTCSDFFKKTSFIFYSQKALKKCAQDIMSLARKEGLIFHAESVKTRLR